MRAAATATRRERSKQNGDEVGFDRYRDSRDPLYLFMTGRNPNFIHEMEARAEANNRLTLALAFLFGAASLS
jgi:hypothetical protein